MPDGLINLAIAFTVLGFQVIAGCLWCIFGNSERGVDEVAKL